MFTHQDLATMQAWPLERKIRVTQTRILEWYKHYNGAVRVSFSGGADSTVLLDLARRVSPEIGAVFVNTTFEFPEIVQFVKGFDNVEILTSKRNYRQVVETFGYPSISKETSTYLHRMQRNPACVKAYHDGAHLQSPEWIRAHFSSIPFSFWKCMLGFTQKMADDFLQTGVLPKSQYGIPKRWQYLIDAPFEISDRCCYHLKKAPVLRHSKAHGYHMIVGTLAVESHLRKQMWMRQGCNAYAAKEPKSAPLSFWTEQDILQYLQRTNIPYCSLYGDIVDAGNGKLRFTGYQRTGCMGCLYGCHLEGSPNRLQMLKVTHPAIYNYLFEKLGYKQVCDFIGIAY